MRSRAAIPTLACAIALAAGCGGGGDGPAFAPSEVEVTIERAFPALAFARPLALLQAPGDPDRWFVAEQAGIVRVFANDPDVDASDVFIDITSLVGASSGERGLLGMAFDPNFASNGHVYLSYTRSSPALTSYISRFTSTDGGRTLDPDSAVTVLTLPQPYTNHNGGHVLFGPDGYLYAGFGDGGSANDPENRAQDTTNLWGTIIRIDVGALPYTIPLDNVFSGNARCASGTSPEDVDCPEIHAWGLRNPWRFSFDRLNGELWAGDVGQGAWEEIDRISAGGNYGWRIREGAHCNIPPTDCPTAGLTDPVAEYGRDVGQSVTGGYVYRGTQIGRLAGHHVFGDFGSGRIMALAQGADAPEELLDTDLNIPAFGEDDDGELYVIDHDGGGLYRLLPAP